MINDLLSHFILNKNVNFTCGVCNDLLYQIHFSIIIYASNFQTARLRDEPCKICVVEWGDTK